MQKKMKKNKAQMEIMGLAIIILLIGVGLLFALQYSLKKPMTTVQKTKESILAANFLTTLLNTNTECNNRMIKELLQDCVLGRPIDCGGQKPCEFAKEKIDFVLDNSLKQWNKRYDFTIEGSDATKAITSSSTQRGKACKAERESKTHLLTITAGYDISLKLDIC
ncbi:hypothetical protein HY484_04425 [Candidatus Woesearchaeota archaeon]|nr:hypothetical protein [Candidatus Woesearchaeota archaeon]